MSAIKCTVIIPVYHYWDLLEPCLESLSKQTLPADEFEIIIANNEEKPFTPDYLSKYSNVVLIHEPKIGSYAARNAAIRIAKGEILAFTDADCIIDERWLENGIAYLKANPDVKRIAGSILISDNGLSDGSLSYERIYAFKQKESAARGISVTANLITYKSMFDEVGLFDDSFVSGGDTDWNLRAHKLGFKIAFVPDVIVYHPARTISQILRKARRLYPYKVGHLQKNKLKLFFYGFKSLKPPFISFYLTFKSDKPKGVADRLKVVKIIYMRRLVQFHEHYRLMMGGTKVRD